VPAAAALLLEMGAGAQAWRPDAYAVQERRLDLSCCSKLLPGSSEGTAPCQRLWVAPEAALLGPGRNLGGAASSSLFSRSVGE